MSLDAPTSPPRSLSGVARFVASVWDYQAPEKTLNLIMTVLAAVCFSYVFVAVKTVATGTQLYQYGDFFALWTSAVVTHGGGPALNYDADALHLRQVAMGMHDHAYNPFPYPPTLLLLLAPLGRFGIGAAFCLFMIPSFALYLWAMVGGRLRDAQWAIAAAVAPATGIVIISGQSGFLSGALMIGGLRLAGSRPILSGVLFGLLTYKPQLGVLVPFALVAAGLWRTIAAACVTVVVGVIASSLFFGVEIWPLWFGSITEYAGRFSIVVELMPTIYANALMLGAPRGVALAAQLLVAVPVVVIVWRAFRAGPTPQACALLLAGTFLATPHAFNYDMPMLTAAVVWYVEQRYRASRSLDIGEIVSLFLVIALPVAMLVVRGTGFAFTWAPELLLFLLIARSRAELAARTRPLAAEPVAA